MNQQRGYDLHRMVDASKAAELAIEHRPSVAWFRGTVNATNNIYLDVAKKSV